MGFWNGDSARTKQCGLTYDSATQRSAINIITLYQRPLESDYELYEYSERERNNN